MRFKKAIPFTIILIVIITGLCRAQSDKQVPLLKVIHKMEQKTPYSFLYRDAVVAHIDVSRLTDSTAVTHLSSMLSPYKIGVKIDTTRHQVFLYELKYAKLQNPSVISGLVVDASTGSHLPFASIVWNKNGAVMGTTTGPNGHFNIDRTLLPLDQKVNLKFSYLGYHSEAVTLRIGEKIPGLTIRLAPDPIEMQDVVINGNAFYHTPNDPITTLAKLGQYSTVGESSSIRSLQTFPSVGLNIGLHEGLNIRGSEADGLKVLLDGAPIYNQSHLFGMLDIFNPSVLQTVAFHYDVVPAQYEAPFGGVLAFITQSGSQNKTGGSASLSNVAYSGTLDGPLLGGKGSWLLSGRHSYMNLVNWFNNDKLIEWGLNTNRRKGPVGQQQVRYDPNTQFPEKPSANFYDFHAKIMYEFPNGGRLNIGSYVGGDNTAQKVKQYAYTSNFTSINDRIGFQQYKTINNWGNSLFDINLQEPLGEDVYYHSLVSYSLYHSQYSKDNFQYNRKDASTGQVMTFEQPFSNHNDLRDFKVDQSFDIQTGWGIVTTGATYHRFNIIYSESSVWHPGYYQKFISNRLDIFSQYDITTPDLVNIHVGGRGIYFSDGNYLRFSPRISLLFLPDKPVSFSVGFSRNYEFLHRLNVYNETSSDLWIPTTNHQPPASDNYWTAGIYLHPFKHTYFQVEAYQKDMANLRLPDVTTRALTQTAINSPWFYRNNGYARGLEFLYQQHIGPFLWDNTFTWSRVRLQNKVLNNGKPYYAEWDHTYKVTSGFQLSVFSRFDLSLNWMFASGAPNQLALSNPSEKPRLPDYSRLDASIVFHTLQVRPRFSITLSFINLLNQNNVWYRENTLVIDRSITPAQLSYVPVDVFDLGFQPSFKIRWEF